MPHSPSINNAFYDDLGERWFEDDGHAIALLRAEGHAKTAYALEVFERLGIASGAHVLDVACGAGLVSLPLAAAGFTVHGVDLAEGALGVARARVPEGSAATFAVADATALPDADARYDAVLLFDMLEHVESVPAVLAEAARVVKPGGPVLFNTFNRTPLATLVAVHGFKVVTRDAPAHVHLSRYFVPPSSLRASARYAGLRVAETRGLRPRLDGAFWRSVARRSVDPGFRFTTTSSEAIGYIGYAVRER